MTLDPTWLVPWIGAHALLFAAVVARRVFREVTGV